MGRSGFSTSNFLRALSTPVTAAPLSMSIWAKPGAAGSSRTLMGLFNSGAGPGSTDIKLYIRSTGELRLEVANGGTSDNPATGDPVVGAWNHCAAVLTSASARAVYLNASKVATSGSITPAGLDRVVLGAAVGSSAIEGFNGDLAEAALWDAALSDDEIAELAAGTRPLLVRPQNLVGYWPLLAESGGENPFAGDVALALNGTVTVADHVPIFRE